MKGVILSECDTRLVDVAHDLPRQNLTAAAFWLREVLPYFPQAVHLAVIDPGVGTNRRAAVVRAGDHLLVGPDNGVLLPTARAIIEAGDGSTATNAIDVFEWNYGDTPSSTFHGRDVFAPAAAAVHETGLDAFTDLAAVRPLPDPVEFELPTPSINEETKTAVGEVLVVDDFGNVITNISGTLLEELERVTVNGETVPVQPTYATVSQNSRLATVGSHENVELAVNTGRGDEAFRLEAGDRVELTW